MCFSYWIYFQLCQEREGKICSEVSVLCIRVVGKREVNVGKSMSVRVFVVDSIFLRLMLAFSF